MDSIGPECTDLKWEYDNCFNKWFRESYLRQKPISHDSACGELFQKYKDCVKDALQKQGIDLTELEKSMIKNDNDSSDAKN